MSDPYAVYIGNAAKQNGLNEGYSQGLRDGQRQSREQGRSEGIAAGKEKGYDTALGHMQKWVDRAEGLESVFAEGGLKRLWRNKLIFSSTRSSYTDSPLKDRRNVFLHMLAYAEYFQSNVADIPRILNSLSNRANELANRIKSGTDTPKESIDALMMMSKQTASKAHVLKQTQEDDMLKKWIPFRVKQLEESVKYLVKDAIIPDRKSIPANETVVGVGYEIKHDKFDIVTDARKYLGESRNDKQLESVGY